MTKLTEAQINDIADKVEIGMICYVHKVTGEVIYFPDELRGIEPEEEFWGKDMKKVEADIDSYIEVAGMHSGDAFMVMEDFIDTVEDKRLASSLINALNKRKPFQNFKYIIDGEDDYRKKWFEYKSDRNLQFVKRQLPYFDYSDDYYDDDEDEVEGENKES